mgnify:CR=1 FL=1|tara:strand:- start:9221 stop:9457 length:237 start_codon:yes stop_codon:yes gene_type:complete
MEVQAIRVNKLIPKKEADLMVKKLGFKTNIKPNPQYKNFHSYRQIQPKEFIKDSFRMKTLKRRGQTKLIMVVLGRRKK